MLVQPPDLTSATPHLLARSVDLNGGRAATLVEQIVGAAAARPIARYVDKGDIPHPPAPAWYLPHANDIYIHVDAADIKRVPQLTWGSTPSAVEARILGLLCHEAGHAAISDLMTGVQKTAPQHNDLLTLLEELRVENHALRRTGLARPFLRASFALILSTLPDEFTNKSHIVRAWALACGRTLAGVAARDETEAVDTAARTLLGDDVVDALTDLLQEAMTVRLDTDNGRERMIAICDEWVDIVGEPAEHTGCTRCAREAEPGETPTTMPGKPAEGDDGDTSGPASDPADDGDGSDDSDPGLGGGAPADDDETGKPGSWGKAGVEVDDDDDDAGGTGDDLLSDEDAELMSMLTRDLADLMQDEWTREPETAQVANSAEWAQTVFGNKKRSTRLTQTEPTSQMRQHVVHVAQALSNLALPTVTKVAKQSEVPPGRLRSREALRASAERASGRMVTAKPWKATARRHATARPLIIGIATDTSGSMRWAEQGVAEFAYVYTNAGHRIGARTAAVTFGTHVHRIARPGEVMDHVERKEAADGTEEFDHAAAALDGVLHLTTPGYAARILLVVSDGAFVKDHETDKATEWLRRMDKAGTHVLWISDRSVDIGTGATWLRSAAKKLPHVTLVTVEGVSGYRSPSAAPVPVFDLINKAALEAIRTNVH